VLVPLADVRATFILNIAEDLLALIFAVKLFDESGDAFVLNRVLRFTFHLAGVFLVDDIRLSVHFVVLLVD
jgi:hypothetical protein